MSDPTPTPTPTPSSSKPKPEALKPLTGVRSALEHTGIPRSLLTWKPRLPSRNWSIFWTVSGTLLYLYYDDRKQCKAIKEETLRKIEHMGREVMPGGALGEVRRIKVYGARCPEDGDDDRALRYFRKYMKPYLVAAAIDYEYPLVPPIIHGSVTRSLRSLILSKRRQAAGLEPVAVPLSLPGAMDPAGEAQRELEGGTVLVGRASFKEYMEGMRRGWMGDVNHWSLEEDVKRKVEGDGTFDELPEPSASADESTVTTNNVSETEATLDVLPPPAGGPAPLTSKSSILGSLSLSRPAPAPTAPISTTGSPTPVIPAHMHLPPSPLPPQPPLLLLPYTNHMGFKAFPYFIYQFFTERHRVRAGADAALALIDGQTRPLAGPTRADEGAAHLDANTGKLVRQGGDLDFDLEGESFVRPSFAKFPSQIEQTRKDYYDALRPRVQSILDLRSGKREMTEAEQSGKTKVETLDELKEERIKKEMRWCGGEDGYEVVRPETGVVWDDRWAGWLRVFVPASERK